MWNKLQKRRSNCVHCITFDSASGRVKDFFRFLLDPIEAEMRILIYGATEAGYMAALRLSNDHDVTLIDEQEQLPDWFSNLDINYISGSGADVAALEQAETSNVDLFIACFSLDEANRYRHRAGTAADSGHLPDISVPDAIDVEHFSQDSTKLFEYRIKEDSIILNKRIMDMDVKRMGFPYKSIIFKGIHSDF